MAKVKKETRSVRTFKVNKNSKYQYMQCDNAYNPERPFCHNTIKDGDEYLTVILTFDDGYKMRYDFCEGCMHAKLSEEEIENARGNKRQTKNTRIQTLVNEIRNRLETYYVSDKTALAEIEAKLEEIVNISNGK